MQAGRHWQKAQSSIQESRKVWWQQASETQSQRGEEKSVGPVTERRKQASQWKTRL